MSFTKPCDQCRKTITFVRDYESKWMPVDPGFMKAVLQPRQTVGKCFLFLVQETGRVERCQEAAPGETAGLLGGFKLHRSTCQKQGVPKS